MNAPGTPSSDLAPGVDELPPRLMLYDGVCGLCNGTVRFLLRIDRERRFRYAPLQGETAERIRREHPEIPRDLESFVYVEDGAVHLRSRAFVVSARHLHYPWRAVSWLRVVPRPLSDLVYGLVARARYRVFGKSERCQVPSPKVQYLFLP